ncbi:hypothetical protein TNCV_2120191 [Trichonephila clavipes]|nr:hypothetical protein TNCV_2120191 [Trichonephila clavipes]
MGRNFENMLVRTTLEYPLCRDRPGHSKQHAVLSYPIENDALEASKEEFSFDYSSEVKSENSLSCCFQGSRTSKTLVERVGQHKNEVTEGANSEK